MTVCNYLKELSLLASQRLSALMLVTHNQQAHSEPQTPYSNPAQNQPRTPLLTSSEAQHQMQRRLLLDVVVAQRPAVLQLLAREDESLLIRRNALLVLDLALHVVDGV